jgi:hypothetical protein
MPEASHIVAIRILQPEGNSQFHKTSRNISQNQKQKAAPEETRSKVAISQYSL